jgi:ComF family protein
MFGSYDSIVNRISHLRLTAARGLSRALAASLFPPRCCLCGFPGASLDLDLCAFCHADLPRNLAHAPGLVEPFRYEYPVDEMIRRLKYNGIVANARVLGVLLAQTARERAQPLPRLLVPVPLHPAKLRERGFNQSNVLARYAGRVLEIPVAPAAVRRIRNTQSQTSLDVSERHSNVRGAFALGGARALRRLLDAAHVAIVDDVVTTGSTVAELRGVLLTAGVRQVDVWAVARVATRATPSAHDSSTTARSLPTS